MIRFDTSRTSNLCGVCKRVMTKSKPVRVIGRILLADTFNGPMTGYEPLHSRVADDCFTYNRRHLDLAKVQVIAKTLI
jgi:hypothetical protein